MVYLYVMDLRLRGASRCLENADPRQLYSDIPVVRLRFYQN